MTGQPAQPPPRWGPLKPQTWPQDDNMIPSAGGMWMPPIETANAERARQESFTMSGTFQHPNTITVGQQFNLYLPTDQDGDFWCDQIYMVGWGAGLTPSPPQSAYPLAGTIDIVDARTGLALTYPQASCPTTFFSTFILFAFDAGFDVSGSPYPDGFRSTAILPQPFCFTRSGGIQLTLTSVEAWTGLAGPNYTDIAFGGWKEYEFASS